jgi:hypothetical protein
VVRCGNNGVNGYNRTPRSLPGAQGRNAGGQYLISFTLRGPENGARNFVLGFHFPFGKREFTLIPTGTFDNSDIEQTLSRIAPSRDVHATFQALALKGIGTIFFERTSFDLIDRAFNDPTLADFSSVAGSSAVSLSAAPLSEVLQQEGILLTGEGASLAQQVLVPAGARAVLSEWKKGDGPREIHIGAGVTEALLRGTFLNGLKDQLTGPVLRVLTFQDRIQQEKLDREAAEAARAKALLDRKAMSAVKEQINIAKDRFLAKLDRVIANSRRFKDFEGGLNALVSEASVLAEEKEPVLAAIAKRMASVIPQIKDKLALGELSIGADDDFKELFLAAEVLGLQTEMVSVLEIVEDPDQLVLAAETALEVSSPDKTKAAIHYQLGQLNRRLEVYDVAQTELETAVSLDPENQLYLRELQAIGRIKAASVAASFELLELVYLEALDAEKERVQKIETRFMRIMSKREGLQAEKLAAHAAAQKANQNGQAQLIPLDTSSPFDLIARASRRVPTIAEVEAKLKEFGVWAENEYASAYDEWAETPISDDHMAVFMDYAPEVAVQYFKQKFIGGADPRAYQYAMFQRFYLSLMASSDEKALSWAKLLENVIYEIESQIISDLIHRKIIPILEIYMIVERIKRGRLVFPEKLDALRKAGADKTHPLRFAIAEIYDAMYARESSAVFRKLNETYKRWNDNPCEEALAEYQEVAIQAEELFRTFPNQKGARYLVARAIYNEGVCALKMGNLEHAEEIVEALRGTNLEDDECYVQLCGLVEKDKAESASKAEAAELFPKAIKHLRMAMKIATAKGEVRRGDWFILADAIFGYYHVAPSHEVRVEAVEAITEFMNAGELRPTDAMMVFGRLIGAGFVPEAMKVYEEHQLYAGLPASGIIRYYLLLGLLTGFMTAAAATKTKLVEGEEEILDANIRVIGSELYANLENPDLIAALQSDEAERVQSWLVGLIEYSSFLMIKEKDYLASEKTLAFLFARTDLDERIRATVLFTALQNANHLNDFQLSLKYGKELEAILADIATDDDIEISLDDDQELPFRHVLRIYRLSTLCDLAKEKKGEKAVFAALLAELDAALAEAKKMGLPAKHGDLYLARKFALQGNVEAAKKVLGTLVKNDPENLMFRVEQLRFFFGTGDVPLYKRNESTLGTLLLGLMKNGADKKDQLRNFSTYERLMLLYQEVFRESRAIIGFLKNANAKPEYKPFVQSALKSLLSSYRGDRSKIRPELLALYE